ncbi:DNA polymerase III subunit gamma and tau [Nonomuraea sp. NPDC050328]|uniref:DNA polymerase III subunit gamma and tau n=1 Tax=Nonomuraea sp. NPDC050328 TaxID=3364361 RepID=UPI0037A2F592
MSLALYRKYRPGTFAEVKGQDHVTEPLRQALRSGRINHAYLFSGPRGCGKTSSARILARSLNCEKGPTPEPCGECESCVALAATGPGHLDVIEIDAASHGGVDDARDLRERAFFAPVSARFKIYIIDEAHMVTREGFNALLKLVEEPPPHLKFIFATTEPEKVIGTIKSRTHHYPFRLMPPATLKALLEEILVSEDVPFEPAALPLVVRAGAGSARDSLSILDQLLAGADDAGITYGRAVSLLGYTDGDLLDEIVTSFAARDGAAVFQAVNRVIEGGHDPRRFATDLLERFRDLVILANVPEAASSGLLDRPGDELERLVQQASSMGPAELTRAAEIFNTGLTEMRGATSPRLLLELMCARVLLPGAAQGEEALLARLERLERSGVVSQVALQASPSSAGASHSGAISPQVPVSAQPPAPVASPPPVAEVVARVEGAGSGTAGEGEGDWPEAVRPGAAAAAPSVPQAPAPAPAPQGGGSALAGIQAQWPAVLAALKSRSIVVWANVNTNAQVVGVEGNIVTLGFTQVGAMKNFTGGGKDAVVAAVLNDVLGGHWRVEAVVGGSPAPRAQPGGSARPAPYAPSSTGAPASAGSPSSPGAPGAVSSPAAPGSVGSADGGPGAGSGAPGSGGAEAAGGPGQSAGAAHGGPGQGNGGSGVVPEAVARPTTDESWPDAPDEPDPGSPPMGAANGFSSASGAPASGGSASSGAAAGAPVVGAGLAAARSAARAAAQAGPRPPAPRKGGASAWPDAVPGKGADADEVDPLNDADADVDEVGGMELLKRELGAVVIGEIDHT